jgi:phage gpG-like protein
MIELTFDKKELTSLNDKIRRISVNDRFSVTKKFFDNIAKETELTMKRDILSGQVLKVRTGRLRSSIAGVIIKTNDELTAIIGSGVRQGNRISYANIHEVGGVIRPKRGKYLAIPLKGALTSSGSQLRGGAMSARDFPNTFIRRGKSGNPIIFQKRGKGVIPLFVLKKSVTIPARRYMARTVAIVKPKAEKIMELTIRKHLEGK